MFVQVIQGKVSNAQELKAQVDKWNKELRPGATGALGSTGGVAEDGTAFMAARFDSEQSARANSDRHEQGQWWAETEKLFAGSVSFTDSSDVQVLIEPSDDAGFVQVITSTVSDRARLEQLNGTFASEIQKSRPEVVGAVTVWDGDRAIDITYFSSEAEAREGEKKDLPPEHQALFQEWQSLLQDVSYLDLKEPWLF
jgi:hypothetical protein